MTRIPAPGSVKIRRGARVREPEGETLGSALRRHRTERGLRPTELAQRAAVPRASLRDWESGRHAPPVSSLERLLVELDADARTRARLLAWTGAPEARVALSRTPWGAPVDLGEVLRAMRRRQGSAQADVARAVGVGQGTIAKWEAGDALPGDEALDRILAALRATPEEIAAVQTVQRGPTEPNGDLLARTRDVVYHRPVALRGVLLLGLESELWAGAVRDPSLEPALARMMAVRAHQALIRGAWSEVEPHVRRAARLARIAGDLDALAPGLYALNWIRRRRDPAGAALSLSRWSGRMRDSAHREWLDAARSLALVRAGEVERGVRLLETLLEREPPGTAGRRSHGDDLVEAWLLAGEPERAQETLLALGDDAGPIAAAKVAAARGKEPPPGLLTRLRESDDAILRDEATRIERLASLARRGRNPRLT